MSVTHQAKNGSGKRKQLSFDAPAELIQTVKLTALQQGVTVTAFVLEAITTAVNKFHARQRRREEQGL